MEKKKRRYFPDEFKRQAAERVETSGLSIMDVATELGVHETQLRRWIRQFGKSGTGPARRPNTQAHGPSPADLAAENDEPCRAIGPSELPVVAPSVRATTGDGEC